MGAPLTAGVGSDGDLSAVVTRNNELVTAEQEQLWGARLARILEAARAGIGLSGSKGSGNA